MSRKNKNDLHAIGRAKLERLQRSPRYKSLLSPEFIEIYEQVKSSAYAGRAIQPIDGHLTDE